MTEPQQWSGGECPVRPDTLVEVMFRGVSSFEPPCRAAWLRWTHKKTRTFPGNGDIIAYRISEANND